MDGIRALYDLQALGFEVRKVDTPLGGIGLKVHGQGKGTAPADLLQALQADKKAVIEHLNGLERREDGLRRSLRALRIRPFD